MENTNEEILNVSKVDTAITEAEYNESGEIYDAEEAFAMIRKNRFGDE